MASKPIDRRANARFFTCGNTGAIRDTFSGMERRPADGQATSPKTAHDDAAASPRCQPDRLRYPKMRNGKHPRNYVQDTRRRECVPCPTGDRRLSEMPQTDCEAFRPHVRLLQGLRREKMPVMLRRTTINKRSTVTKFRFRSPPRRSATCERSAFQPGLRRQHLSSCEGAHR